MVFLDLVAFPKEKKKSYKICLNMIKYSPSIAKVDNAIKHSNIPYVGKNSLDELS